MNANNVKIDAVEIAVFIRQLMDDTAIFMRQYERMMSANDADNSTLRDKLHEDNLVELELIISDLQEARNQLAILWK